MAEPVAKRLVPTPGAGGDRWAGEDEEDEVKVGARGGEGARAGRGPPGVGPAGAEERAPGGWAPRAQSGGRAARGGRSGPGPPRVSARSRPRPCVRARLPGVGRIAPAVWCGGAPAPLSPCLRSRSGRARERVA